MKVKTFTPQQPPSIKAEGRGYVVHANGQVIKCHNIATAQFYLRKANKALLTNR